MADAEFREVSGSDIESLEQKLREFHQALAPNEQMVLEWLMARAAQTPDEVQGHTLSNPLTLTANKFWFSQALGLNAPINPATQYANKFAQKMTF